MPRAALVLLVTVGAALTVVAVLTSWIGDTGNESVYILRGYGASSYSALFTTGPSLGLDSGGFDAVFLALPALALLFAFLPRPGIREIGLVVLTLGSAALAPFAVEVLVAESESFDARTTGPWLEVAAAAALVLAGVLTMTQAPRAPLPADTGTLVARAMLVVAGVGAALAGLVSTEDGGTFYENYDVVDLVVLVVGLDLAVAAVLLHRSPAIPWIALALAAFLAAQVLAYGLEDLFAYGPTDRVAYLHALVVAPLAVGAIGLIAMRLPAAATVE